MADSTERNSQIIPSILRQRNQIRRSESPRRLIVVDEKEERTQEAMQATLLFPNSLNVRVTPFGELWVRSWPKSETRELSEGDEHFMGTREEVEIGTVRWNFSETVEKAINSREEVHKAYVRGEGSEVLKVLSIIDALKLLRERVGRGEFTSDNINAFADEGIKVLEDAHYINVVKESRKNIRDGFIKIFSPNKLGQINSANAEMKASHVWSDAIDELKFFLYPEDKNLFLYHELLNYRDKVRQPFAQLDGRIRRILSTHNRSREFSHAIESLQNFAKDELSLDNIEVQPYAELAAENRVLLGVPTRFDRLLLNHYKGEAETERIFSAKRFYPGMMSRDAKGRVDYLLSQNSSFLRKADDALKGQQPLIGKGLYG